MENNIEIIVGGECYETYPCQHYVTVKYSDGSQKEFPELLFGDKIVQMYKNNHLEVPDHFKEYDPDHDELKETEKNKRTGKEYRRIGN